ncbi:Protein smg8 [Pelomyxa schiedti]|nr:Protein smg8 [Pelomyxa schiedti]
MFRDASHDLAAATAIVPPPPQLSVTSNVSGGVAAAAASPSSPPTMTRVGQQNNSAAASASAAPSQPRSRGGATGAASCASGAAASAASDDDKCVVVGVVGATSSQFTKSLMSRLADVPVSALAVSNLFTSQNGDCRVDKCSTASQRIIFLHLSTVNDSCYFLNCISPHNTPHEFNLWLNSTEKDYFRAFFLLFFLCHFILITHNSTTFDISYLSNFHYLQWLRQGLGPSIHQVLMQRQSTLSLNIKQPNLTLSPTLLFIFTPASALVTDKSGGSTHTFKPNKRIRLPKSEALESQVRLLLHKAHLCPPEPNITMPLFSLNTPQVCFVIRRSIVNPLSGILPLLGDNPTIQCEVDDLDSLRSTLTLKIAEGLLLSSWTNVLQILMEIFALTDKGAKQQLSMAHELNERISTFIDADYKFSSSYCSTALPAARDEYYAELPQKYTSALHESKLLRGEAILRKHGRGPAFPVFLDQYQRNVTSHWLSGRQLCDAVSLTGRNCIYQKHEVCCTPVDSSLTLEMAEWKKPKPHNSSYRTIDACQCGRSHSLREDPFTLEEANHSFSHSHTCCKSLVALSLPCFNPSPGVLLSMQSGGFLNVLASKFPKFPDWSLVIVGTGQYYNHKKGLQQVGFLPGKNFLVPWEITTNDFSVPKVEALGSTLWRIRSTMQAKPRKLILHTEFFGHEYECPQGHRFNCSNFPYLLNVPTFSRFFGTWDILASKARKPPLDPSVPDSVKILMSDLPVFLPCPCNENEVAQLKRLFVVTPDSSKLVLLCPRVIFPLNSNVRRTQPYKAFDPGMNIFLPPNSFVCLSFPYIYHDESVPLQTGTDAVSAFVLHSHLIGE